MTEPAYRALFTGSRSYNDRTTIHAAIEQLLIDAGPRKVIVVHGHCPDGADRHADDYTHWLRDRGANIDVERHPAQGHRTQDFGPWPGAGPRRNKYMVGLGANVCHAFIGLCNSMRCRRPGPHLSHGASGCADLAEKAGIPTIRWSLT